jgi:hypothetical protein
MADIIQIRRDTVANWASVNPTLAQGEQGFETDSGFMKIGDGVSDWNTLPYLNNVDTSTSFEESFVATAAQTNFTLAQLPAAAWVWQNGAAQDASVWSTVGNDVVLVTPATALDTIEVYYLTGTNITGVAAADVTYIPTGNIEATNVQDAIDELNTPIYVTKTAAYTAVNNNHIYADTATTGAFTVTLPITPVANETVSIQDIIGNFSTISVTVARNGQTIMGLAEDIVLNIDNSNSQFLFTGTDWRVSV